MHTFKQFLLEDITTSGQYLKISDLKSAASRAKLADQLGVPAIQLKNMSDSELQNILKHVGKHDFSPDSEFDAEQLRLGIKTEREHTKSDLIAKIIAKDHLKEDPKYYTKLQKVEGKH